MADNQATLDAINYHKSQLYDLLDMARTAGILTEETNVAIVRVSDLQSTVDYMRFTDVDGCGNTFDIAARDRFETIIKETHV